MERTTTRGRGGARRWTAWGALVALALTLLPGGAAAAAAPLPVGPEVAAATARPGAYQVSPDVAWNGSVYLVVWSELVEGQEGRRIWATRVSASGQVLDPAGILLSGDSTNDNGTPSVAAGNGRFLVVWEEDRSPTDIVGALVSGTGTVLRQWYVSSAEDEQYEPDVAWNGELFLVVWIDRVDGDPLDIYGTRVRWSGRTLDGCGTDTCVDDSHGIDIGSSAEGDQVDPAVAALRTGPAAGTFLVSWTDQGGPAGDVLRMTRMSPSAVPLDGTGVLLAGPAGSPDRSELAARGTDVRAVWTDSRRASAPDVFGTRVVPAPTAPPAPAPVSGKPVVAAPAEQSDPAVTALGAGHLVVWTDTRGGAASTCRANRSAGRHRAGTPAAWSSPARRRTRRPRAAPPVTAPQRSCTCARSTGRCSAGARGSCSVWCGWREGTRSPTGPGPLSRGVRPTPRGGDLTVALPWSRRPGAPPRGCSLPEVPRSPLATGLSPSGTSAGRPAPPPPSTPRGRPARRPGRPRCRARPAAPRRAPRTAAARPTGASGPAADAGSSTPPPATSSTHARFATASTPSARTVPPSSRPSAVSAAVPSSRTARAAGTPATSGRQPSTRPVPPSTTSCSDHHHQHRGRPRRDEPAPAERGGAEEPQHPVAAVEGDGDGLAGEGGREHRDREHAGDDDVDALEPGRDLDRQPGGAGQRHQGQQGQDEGEQQLLAVGQHGSHLAARLGGHPGASRGAAAGTAPLTGPPSR